MDLLGDVVHVESRFSPIGGSVRVGSRYVLCLRQTNLGSETFWTHPMELLGDEAQVEARFGPFGDISNPNARLVHDLRRTYHRLECRFGRTRWYS